MAFCLVFTDSVRWELRENNALILTNQTVRSAANTSHNNYAYGYIHFLQCTKERKHGNIT